MLAVTSCAGPAGDLRRKYRPGRPAACDAQLQAAQINGHSAT